MQAWLRECTYVSALAAHDALWEVLSRDSSSLFLRGKRRITCQLPDPQQIYIFWGLAVASVVSPNSCWCNRNNIAVKIVTWRFQCFVSNVAQCFSSKKLLLPFTLVWMLEVSLTKKYDLKHSRERWWFFLGKQSCVSKAEKYFFSSISRILGSWLPSWLTE